MVSIARLFYLHIHGIYSEYVHCKDVLLIHGIYSDWTGVRSMVLEYVMHFYTRHYNYDRVQYRNSVDTILFYSSDSAKYDFYTIIITIHFFFQCMALNLSCSCMEIVL